MQAATLHILGNTGLNTELNSTFHLAQQKKQQGGFGSS